MKKQDKLELPILLINVKTYKEGTGKDVLKVAEAAEKVIKETGKYIALALQATDIRMVTEKFDVPVYAQHADSHSYGSHTGSTTLEALKQAGAVGTLINHSEKKLSRGEIDKTVMRCKEIGMYAIVCAKNEDVAATLSLYRPHLIAVEPPELIGGDVSVSKARPEVIEGAVRKVWRAGKVPVICGAGVTTKEDVKTSLKLGAKGVLLAHAVVGSKNHYKTIKKLSEALI